MTVSIMIADLSLTLTVKLQAKVSNGQLYDCVLIPAEHSVSTRSGKAQPANLMSKLNELKFADIKQTILEAYDENEPCEAFDCELDIDCIATVDYYPAESSSWDCPGAEEDFDLVDLVAQDDSFLDLTGLYDLTYYLDSSNGLIEHIIEQVKQASAG